jgi:hypothetical protein
VVALLNPNRPRRGLCWTRIARISTDTVAVRQNVPLKMALLLSFPRSSDWPRSWVAHAALLLLGADTD